MTGNKSPAEELKSAVAVLRRMAIQGAGTASIHLVLKHLQDLEDAVNWGTACLSCAKVLDSSVRETQAKERAERIAADYRQEVLAHTKKSAALSSLLRRANERVRAVHRRALDAEKKLASMQLIPVYITDHTFSGVVGGLCPEVIFGVKCDLGEDFHHMKPSRCPEPDTCGCDCSCTDTEELGHRCPRHTVRSVADASPDRKMTVAAWEHELLDKDEFHYYVSTACLHEIHGECRLACKFCAGPHGACLCSCHEPEPEAVAEDPATDTDDNEESEQDSELPIVHHLFSPNLTFHKICEVDLGGSICGLPEEYHTDDDNAVPAEWENVLMDPVMNPRCPANSSDSCVYESQGYRRCAKGCELSVEKKQKSD